MAFNQRGLKSSSAGQRIVMLLRTMAKKHITSPSASPHGLAAMRSDTATRHRVTISISNHFNQIDSEQLARELEEIPGVYSVYISLQTEMAHIVYDPNLVDLRSLRVLIGQG
jgi:hypothetical protein